MKIEHLVKARTSGIFRFDTAEFDMRVQPIPKGLAQVNVACVAVRDKTAFLRETAEALGFPEHFGYNWDAAYDCLTDLPERFETGLLLSFSDLSGFARDDPEEFAAAVGMLDDAAQYWAQSGNHLLVLIGLEQALLVSDLVEVSPG